jgi:hypothetical protein
VTKKQIRIFIQKSLKKTLNNTKIRARYGRKSALANITTVDLLKPLT